MVQIDLEIRNQFCSNTRNTALQTRHISCREDVRAIVRRVYRVPSVVARTMHGRAAVRNEVEPLLEEVAKRIFEYFNKAPNTVLTQENYDNFFYDLCESFQKKYNALARTAGIMEIRFGIAQKWINMIFKYLSCCEDYPAYSDLFAYCHMPIDSYILKYVRENGLARGKYGLWTRLDRAEYENLASEYRASLSKLYPNYSALHLEFYFWECAKSKAQKAKIVIAPSPSLPQTKTKFYV